MTVRASVGLAHLEQLHTPDQLVDAADQALQRLRQRLRPQQAATAAR